MGLDVGKRGALDGADIADDGPGLEGGRHGRGNFAVDAKRRAHHHQVGAGGGNRSLGGDAVGEAEALDRVDGGLGPGGRRDVVGQAMGARHPGQGRPDQPHADDGQAAEMDAAAHFRNSARASVTARISSSRPTVMRRQSGRP